MRSEIVNNGVFLISIIIPASNEEKRIANVLNSIIKNIDGSVEIIVVSNGSLDNTSSVVRKYNDVTLLEFDNMLGKGGAIMRGLAVSNGDIVGFMDADDAFDIDSITGMINTLKSDSVDCVIASKWKNQKFFSVDEPFLKKTLSRGWNILTRILLGLDFYDTQGGAKFMKRTVYESVVNEIKCSGFEFDVDLLFRISNKNFKVSEQFVLSKFVGGSSFNFGYVPGMFINILKLWWYK
jgi:glycosyltransferase involved in cell wall biosynthesis